ncbi:MAG TPA: hypothetical protein VNN10_13380 [Dehalococcoidia bacterium]|nr:hypothetical protein [Dehalococcoidia bacterium]
MGVDVYLRGKREACEFFRAVSVEWAVREVEALRYGKVRRAKERWLVVLGEDGRVLAQFKDADVSGVRFYGESEVREPQLGIEQAMELVNAKVRAMTEARRRR